RTGRLTVLLAALATGAAWGGQGPAAAQRMTPSPSYLALGDSYTIGESVAEEGRWPVQLAAALLRRGVDVAPPRIVARTGWTVGELGAGIDAAAPRGPY